MAVTVYWVEYAEGETPGTTAHDNYWHDGADAGVKAHSVTSATNLNFGNTPARDLTPSSYPIAAGANSYAKYFRLQFSGSYTQISNAKIWKSAGAYVTGEFIWFSGNVDFTAPATTSILSSLTDTEWTDYNTGRRIPTAQPSLSNVVLCSAATEAAGSNEATLPEAGEIALAGGYYSGSRSATMVFQLTSNVDTTPAGPVNQKTISLTYDRA